jgi:hypothetical protein
MRVIPQSGCRIQRTTASLRNVYCGPGHKQSIYSCAYSVHNIQLNVSALLLEICRNLDARYTENLVPYITHTLQMTLCELWSRSYTMHLQLRIFRLQYSSERICAAIADISRMLRAIYCKSGAKCSAHPPVYDIWTVVPDICNVITAPHIQTSVFSWTYLRC